MKSFIRIAVCKANGTIALAVVLSKGLLVTFAAVTISLVVLANGSMPAHSQQAPGAGKKAISPGKNFSAAIEAGDYVFLSGTLGRGKDRKIVEGGIKAETKQAMENLKETLAKSGLGMEDVVKVTVFIRNPDDFAAMNEVYQPYFPTDPPARTTVVAGFPEKTANVEIDMIAYRRK